MSRPARRLALSLSFILVLTMGIPTGGLEGSWPLGWLSPSRLSWLFTDAASAAIGVPVQKHGPDGAGSHYAGKSHGYEQPKPVKKPAWTAPANEGEDAFDPATSTKESGRSNASSDIYRNADGSQTVKLSTGKLNYKDRDGKWRPIDTTLEKGSDGRLRTKANSFGVSLAARAQQQPELAKVTLPGGQTFSYQLQGAQAVTPTVDGEESTYAGIRPGVDLKVKTLTNSVKETIVLRGPSSPREFVFPLKTDGLTPRLNDKGELELLDASGAVGLLVPRPFMEDASPVDAMGERAKSFDVTYSLVAVDGKPALKVTAGDTWLNDPKRVWPVAIDPTVYVGKTLNEGDAFVDNETDTDASTQNGDSLAVGRWQNNIARSFVKFSDFDTDGFVGKRITGAKLWVYLTWASTCDSYRYIYVHKVTEAWTVAEVAASNLSGGPAYTSPIGSVKITDHTPGCTNTAANRSVGQWHSVTLDPTTLHDWATNRGGANWNQGLAITGEEGVTDSWKRFTSGNYSDTYKVWLELNYANNVAPQVNALFPPSGTQSPTLTPQLIADGYDPDGFPATLEYNFEIFEESATGAQTKIKESGWRTDKTWTVPSGVLKWGGRYRWQVTLNDGRNNEGVPSYTWQPAWRYALTTPVPQPAVTSSLDQNGDAGFAPGSGSYTTEATDAQVATPGPALAITRSYNSADNRVSGAFGAGWSSLLDAKVTERKDAAGAQLTVEATYPTGQTVAYGRNADGSYSAGLGRYAKLVTVTGGGYKLTDKSGVGYLFTTALATGVYGLTSVTDGNGRALTLTYTGGKVSKLTSSAGQRTLSVAWNGAHVASVSTDPAVAGDNATISTWTYAYAGDQLTTVCPPTSSTQCTTYGYADANLYPSTVENFDAYSYWRMNDAAASKTAASSAIERMGTDVGTHTNVTLGAAGSGALTGSAATSAGYNGSNASTGLPAKAVSQSGYQSISMWFKTSTTANDHVLYAQSWDPLSKGTTKSPYHPVLYIGTDGKVYGSFPTLPAAGKLGQIVGAASGQCLDATNGGTVNGAALILYGCSGAANQQWTLTSSGQFQFTNGSTTRCLKEMGTEAGSRVVVQDCSSTAANQKWRVTGEGRMVSQESGMCLHPLGNGTANSTPLTVWPCDRPYNLQQTWSVLAPAPLSSSATVADGKWHNVVLSAAGDRQTLYLDGAATGTQTGTRIVDIQPRYQYLGAGFLGGGWPAQDNSTARGTGTTDYYTGSLSDVAVFDRPLTTDLVAELYAARTPRKLLAQITRPGGGTDAKIAYDPVTGKVTQVTDANNAVWKLGAPEVKGSSQVYASAVLGAAPTDYWRLNDLPGTTEPYNEVNGNDAVESATVLGGTAGTDGPFRDTIAPKFTPASSSEIVAGGPSIDTAQSYSASAWVNMSDATSNRQAVAVLGNRASGFTLGYDKNLNRWMAAMCLTDADSASCPRTSSTAAPALNTWTHLAATYDAPTKTLRLYVNGAFQASSVLSFTPWTAAGPLAIGKCRYNGTDCDRWAGRIAEVATFGSRLSDAQVKAQFNAADRSATGVPMPARSVSLVDPRNGVRTQTYDLYSGQQVSETDTLGNLTQYGYDSATGTLKLLVDPNGNKTEFGYDARGNVIEQSTWQVQSDQSTKATTRFTYYPDATTANPAPDPRNDKLLTIRDPRTDGTYTTTYAYDTRGNVTSVTDPLGRVSRTTVSDGSDGVPAGLTTREVSPGGAVATTTYTAAGDVEKMVDAAGAVTTFTYDGLGRVLTRTESGDHTTSFTYDKAGRVLTVTEPTVLNRITGAAHTPVTTYVYNADGDVTSTSYADTTGGDATRTETTTYNALGQVESETDAGGAVTTYTYDPFGEIASVTDPAGVTTVAEYDTEGQLLTVKVKDFTGDPDDPSPAADVRSEFHEYDPAGRLIKTTDAMNWATEYEYTDNNLLKTATRVDGAKRFVLERNAYDKAGNLTQQITNDGQTTTTYQLDGAGRAFRTTADPNGLKRTVTAVLSPDDQVLSTTVTDAAGATVGYGESVYDPMGRELASVEYPGARTAPVARWKLGEKTGTTAADSAGNTPAEFTGTDAAWSTDAPPSRPDLTGSLKLTGSRLSTTGPVIDPNRSFTVAAWVKLSNPTWNHSAVSQDGDGFPGFTLGYGQDEQRWWVGRCPGQSDQCSIAESQDTAALDTWTHLTGVYDASARTMSLYVNGAFQNSTPWEGDGNLAGPLSIGDLEWTDGGRSDQWPGNIADVQAYQRALPASEIGEVYRGTSTAAEGTVVRTSYERDADGGVLSSTDANGNITRFEYDEADQLAVTIEPPVRSEVHGGTPVTASPISLAGYNTFGEQTEEKDPTGNVVTVRYDADGQPVETIYPEYTPPGSSVPLRPRDRLEYDKLGQVTKAIDPLGAETTYTYDRLGRLTKETEADGGTTRYGYNLADDVTSVTDATGAKQTATYDYLGRQVTGTEIVRQASTAYTTNYEYGAGGWLSKITSPEGVQQKSGYNALGEVTSTTDAANATTTYQYDGAGRVIRTTLADNTYETSSFDGAGRMVAKRSFDAANAELQKTTARYDRNGNLIAATDPRGITTEFAYDASDLLVSQSEPITANDKIVSTFGYDAAGRPTRFTDGRGNAFWTTYNTWGAEESRIEPATTAHPNLADRTWTTEYDLAGQAVGEIMPGGVKLTHSYDAMGRLTRSSGTGAEAATEDRTYEYDRNGRVTSFSGVGGANTLAYDDRGLLTSVTGPSGNSSFTYTPDGNTKTRVDAAGTTTYGYDTAGRLSSIANPATGIQAGIGYDALSQVAKVTYGGSGNARSFGYDSLHRLTTDELKSPAGASIAKITYGYDADSNLTSKVTTGFAGSASNTYTYDLANRLTSWNNGSATVDYEYDRSGNRTRAGDKTYTYDARNRLESSSARESYEYTARGTLRRTISGTVGRETLADAFGQVTRQQTGEGQYADYKYDGLGRAIKTGFAYTGTGNDLAADGTALYTRDPEGGLVGIQQSGTSVYAWTDRHTDVVAQFTATGAGLAASTTYDPLGKVVATSGALGNLGFQQEFTEAASGRVNMHARWYNPETGQFDTADTADLSPVGDSANANRYGYGNGNPLANIDPTGHSIMGSCNAIFSCLLKGFVDAFDLIDMGRNLMSAVSNLSGTISSMIGGLISDANRWKGSISSAIHDRVNCGAWYMPTKLCNGAVNAISTLGGWACALSGVCDIAYDCFAANGNRNSCALAAGGLLADAVKSLITGGAGGLASRMSSRITSLIKRFNLPDRRKPKATPKSKKPAKKPAKKKKAPAKHKKTKKTKKSSKKTRSSKKNKHGSKPSKKKTKTKAKKPATKKKKGGGGAKPKSSKPKTGGGGGGSKPTTKKPGGSTAVEEKPNLNLGSAKGNDKGGPGYDDRTDFDSCEHSFAPSTRVVMADGSTKAIKDVKVGDKVWSTDPATGRSAVRTVTALHKNRDHELADVTVTTGDRSTRGPTVVHTTQNHPFWDVDARTWVHAGDLQPGISVLRGPNGELQHVTAVRTYRGAADMRDLTIAGIHTYYVAVHDFAALVHNCNRGYHRDEYDWGDDTSGPGGSVRYGGLDELHRPTGVWATLTKDMLDTGQPPNGLSIVGLPKGMGTILNLARGHLLADRLGGKRKKSNLAAITQDPVNSPIMRDGIEQTVYDAVAKGETVQYSVEPIYVGDSLVPRALRISAYGNKGLKIDPFEISNPAGMFGVGDEDW
ncbi:LamG-like jellyroll fold domain-containing protein [Actinoplanes sp. CA-030573]|uniref:LamG-like jellyroll fold domain-containing protein n=1 Tax=Actinoplanes sp. CA-030573 TaxID=3239898 RepID=UPI003D8C3B4C